MVKAPDQPAEVRYAEAQVNTWLSVEACEEEESLGALAAESPGRMGGPVDYRAGRQ